MSLLGALRRAPLAARAARAWFALLDRVASSGSGRHAVADDLHGPSLRSKVMMVALSTTCLALLLSASALLIYELRAYRLSQLNDLQTQADIIAKATAPAMSFKDAKVAAENLHMLQLRPRITAAAVYQPDGSLFASYLQPMRPESDIPRRGTQAGYVTSGDTMAVFHPIEHNGERLGVLYLRADNDMMERLVDYLWILLGVMVASTAAAALITVRLQRAVTEPILQVAHVARNVLVQRDFSLRAPKTSSDEVGFLVDAFNDMLAEVAARTTALEETNRHLSIEMAERRKAEEALKVAARKKDEFLATLAHELRNPLAPISNATEILRRVADKDPALRQRSLDIMSRQLRQMVRLIDDLLDVSRITTGKLLLHKERVDLVRILHSALEVSAPTLEARRHVLEVSLPEQPVYIDADATRLTQVFANLLNNAAKYTAEGGHIALGTVLLADRAEVIVRDNGIGIAPEMQKAVFDMFVQVDQSLDRGRAGLGVGLTLARQLTSMHGGEIRVRSAGEGRGSEFVVSLPLSSSLATPAAITASPDAEMPASPPTAVEPMRVLVADDNIDFATSLSQLLSSLGHEVTTVHDGRAAIEAAERTRPDIVFLDIGMPGFNGHEVARHLRANPDTREALLVAVTGWNQERDRQRSRASGITHHLAKPVTLDQLLPLLAQCQANHATS